MFPDIFEYPRLLKFPNKSEKRTDPEAGSFHGTEVTLEHKIQKLLTPWLFVFNSIVL